MRYFKIEILCPLYNCKKPFYVYTNEEHFFPNGCDDQVTGSETCKNCHKQIYDKYEHKKESTF